MSISPGMYWGVWAFSSKSSGSNLMSLSQVGMNKMVNEFMVSVTEIGRNVASFSAQIPLAGQISMTQTNTGMPASIATADISTAGAAGSVAGRSVYVQLQSQF